MHAPLVHSRPRRLARALKRALDVVVAAVALILAAPLMLVVAVTIRLAMGPPVLFRQGRLGQHGWPFTLYKFRTMREACGADGTPRPDAERLTRLGRLLRATSLDELPEFWNVLRGQMSLVGPRPLLPQYRDLYTPEQWRRHEVPPGIAGPVTARGRNTLSWEQKFALDIGYVDHWSLALDLRLLALTFVKALTGAGVSAPGHPTMPNFEGTRPAAHVPEAGRPGEGRPVGQTHGVIGP